MAIPTMIGIIEKTINANRQLMRSMKIVDVVMFMIAQVVSTNPQVIKSDTRPESDVTRAINLPTDVWL